MVSKQQLSTRFGKKMRNETKPLTPPQPPRFAGREECFAMAIVVFHHGWDQLDLHHHLQPVCLEQGFFFLSLFIVLLSFSDTIFFPPPKVQAFNSKTYKTTRSYFTSFDFLKFPVKADTQSSSTSSSSPSSSSTLSSSTSSSSPSSVSNILLSAPPV